MGGSMFRNAFLIVLMLLALLVGDYHPVPVMERKPISKVVLDEKQLTCLAKNIFYEAPMESYRGKLAVATVTMNRVRHKQFPKTICGVVYQREQPRMSILLDLWSKSSVRQHRVSNIL